MEHKPTGRMISTSIADSTDTRVSDFIETGYNNIKLSNEPQSLPCMASSVRNYGTAGTQIQTLNGSTEGAVFKDCNMLDGSLAAKQVYDRGGEYLKCDSVPWDDFGKRTNLESLPGAVLSLSSTAAACKFIKDEKEPSVIMNTPCPNFHPSPEILALDSCCDAVRKPQPGFGDGDAASFAPAAAGPRPGLEGSPNFLMNLNQTEQLPAMSQAVSTDSRKALVPFDANTAPHMAMYKNEAPRWHMQMSPAEPQYWCQSAGMAEDQFTHSGYSGFQNQAFSQRNPAPFSAFPG